MHNMASGVWRTGLKVELNPITTGLRMWIVELNAVTVFHRLRDYTHVACSSK